MQVIEGKIVTETELRSMIRYTDKLQGKVERLERDRIVLFGLFVVTAVALGYVLAQGVI